MSFRYVTVFTLVFLSLISLASCQKSAPPSVTETVVSEDGVPIRYDSTGSGTPALVFIHGWAGDRSFWDNQSAYFPKHYQVIRIDLAGHGESGLGRKTYSIPAFGGDIAAVVDKLGLKQVILIGHSLGGPAALEAEKRLGSHVIGVVGVDIFYSMFVPPKEKMAELLLKPFRDDFPKAMNGYISSMFTRTTDKVLADRFTRHTVEVTKKEVAIGSLEELFVWYRREANSALNRIGGKLRNINANPYPKAGDKASHRSVVLIPGSGHFIEQEKPEEFNRALEGIIREFTNKIDKPDR